MKKILLLFVVVFMSLMLFGCEFEKPTDPAMFSKIVHDIGDIEELNLEWSDSRYSSLIAKGKGSFVLVEWYTHNGFYSDDNRFILLSVHTSLQTMTQSVQVHSIAIEYIDMKHKIYVNVTFAKADKSKILVKMKEEEFAKYLAKLDLIDLYGVLVKEQLIQKQK